MNLRPSFEVPTVTDKRPAYVAYAAHALHDGFTDLMYVLLPLFQAEFALAYAQTGLLRSIYAGGMALFQVPAGHLAGRFGNRTILALGTGLAACGYLLAGVSAGFAVLVIALAVLGLGLSTQHPIGSELVAETYEGAASRKAIGTYNFAGDIGKMIFPAAIALLLLFSSWRGAALSVGIFGLLAAMAIFVALAPAAHRGAHHADSEAQKSYTQPTTAIPSRANFVTLLSIGVIDSATRMGFLTFLPFLLQQKGASVQSVGFALTLVFAGGAVGKFVCGHLGARLGTIPTVFLTEGLTALCVLLLIPLPLVPAFLLLPVLGIMLNGTSSVLYGSVPELVSAEDRRRAFAIFYTGTIGSGAVSPLIYGLFSDALGIPSMMGIVAGVVLLTLPLAWKLRSAWSSAAQQSAAMS
ncbi:MAG: MFS transporter [Methylobacteriaceae bacterium]|nr:MFS transporter [Methylobacteriaceae bacterium]